MTDDRPQGRHPLERVQPADTWQAAWSFFCRRCGRSWTRRYEVRRYRGSDGEWVVHLRGGHLAQPPGLETRCPRCGGLRVRLLPLHAEDGRAPTQAGNGEPRSMTG